MTHPAIRVENLSKRYRLGEAERYRTLRDTIGGWLRPSSRGPAAVAGARNEVWALNDVSFEVPQGQVLGIIGRNGSGKSTLLKLLSRITEPTQGVIDRWGRVGALLEVGTGFHPELTGRENVFLNGAILGMSRDEIRDKFDEIVDFSGVSQFIDTPVKRYSSGMHVRLAFAVAAHFESEILFVDEVLAVGDLEFQNRCLGKMDQIASDGRTVLFVSHSMSTITRLCNRALWLEQGKLLADGPVNEVVRRYIQDQGVQATDWRRPEPCPNRSHIRSSRLCDDAGRKIEQITTTDTLNIEFECRIFESRPDIRIAIAISDAYESYLFASQPMDRGVSHPTESGDYRYRVRFPGPVLLPQSYCLTVSLYTTSGQHLDNCPHVIRFDVSDAGSKVNADTDRVGMLQLKCDWQLLSGMEAA